MAIDQVTVIEQYQVTVTGDGTATVISAGVQGPAGVGVPTGGTSGQVLAKNSGTNYDTGWVNSSGGGISKGFATAMAVVL